MTVDAPLPGTEVRLDVSAYTIDAVQRAAYRLCDRLSIEITRENSVLVCRVFSAPHHSLTAEDLADFRIECLDQVLRERIRNETEGVRNLVLAQAFAGLVVSDSP